jgi:hypothetical protein
MASPLFEGQIFQGARLSLVWSCELFAKNMKLPKKPSEACSEAHFWLYVLANEGATTENALYHESLSTEFQFIGLGGDSPNSFRSILTSRSSVLNRRLRTSRGS